jgi:hypothetical protein
MASNFKDLICTAEGLRHFVLDEDHELPVEASNRTGMI